MCGPVLDKDIEVTLGEDGEIRFRGPNVAKGYWNRPHASADSWDEEGWFHTGDLGSLDSEGYLSITGRKKELIVTAGGKKIAPDNIESKLKSIKYVSQAVLYGEGKPYCVALVTVDTASVKLPQGSAQQADKEKLLNEVHQKIWSEVENLNKMLASFESIKRIALIEEDFTIDNGLLTPTLKVKRSKVMEHFRDLIESLYEKTN